MGLRLFRRMVLDLVLLRICCVWLGGGTMDPHALVVDIAAPAARCPCVEDVRIMWFGGRP